MSSAQSTDFDFRDKLVIAMCELIQNQQRRKGQLKSVVFKAAASPCDFFVYKYVWTNKKGVCLGILEETTCVAHDGDFLFLMRVFAV